ncbi:MAG: hypothetical protein ABI697_08210 [Devosia sp.]
MPQSTFLEDLMSAGRGIFGLVIGDRRAASYFDFSQRGLATAGIAFLAITAVGIYLPMLVAGAHDNALLALIRLLIIVVLQVAFAAIVLRQAKKLDVFVPFLVTEAWMNFFVSLVAGALTAAGVGGDLLTIIFGLAVIWIEVNIGRFVLGLAPLQIAMLIIAEIIGASIALGIVLLTFPVPPDVAAQLAALG